MNRVLIVAGGRQTGERYQQALGQEGFQTAVVWNPIQMVEFCRQHTPDFMVVDLDLAELGLWSALQAVRGIGTLANIRNARLQLWHVTALRFLVAMGVGGEWAVAAALVSEVFPKKARAHASSIFHASSVIGTSLASLAAIWVGANWEYAYLIGVLPALLIVWVRLVVKEPEKWQRAREEAKAGTGKVGSFKELLTVAPWRGHAFGAMALAAVGLGTFWAVTVAGQDLAREMLISEGATPEEASQKAKFAYGIIQTMGGGLGLVLFGPISARIGRRMTFILFHVAALAITLVVCFLPNSYTTLLILLPVFGFFTLGMHAGYAVYFPELFPDRLRATGMSWGFNGGRLLAATLLILSGKMKAAMDLNIAIAWLGGFFLLGVVVIFFLPETKGKELPT